MTEDQLIFIVDNYITVRQVLDDFNWDYYGVPGQTKCPIHKLGGELKPSARVYEDGSLHCFTCGRTYKSTEILGSIKTVSRIDAAKLLLEKYFIDEVKKEEILRTYRSLKRKSVNESILDCAEDILLQYRHKIPLDSYRIWCRKKDELFELFEDLSKEEQLRKFYAFKNQLEKELNNI